MKAFRRTLSDLGEVSTVHGLRYSLVPRKQKSTWWLDLDRLVWALIVVTATVLASYLSFETYSTWSETPVVTTIGSTALPITALDFPAVTLCSPGNDLNSLYKIHEVSITLKSFLHT